MASSLTSKVVDKYMRCQMALYQVRTDPMLPMYIINALAPSGRENLEG